jgi:dTDP-4-amino-4,6-dideoxygalactose transaminase
VSAVSGTPASTTVPFVDLGRQHAAIQADLRAAFERVMARGDFVLGEEVDEFELEFAGYVGATEAVGVGSGTAAISIGLAALGIGPGDRVIVPAHTYVASALGVMHAGAEPLLCDVDEASGLIDLDSAASVVDSRTAAVLAVHLYGQACDMDAVAQFAASRGLALIEDAAQAHGAGWRGQRVGSFGAVAVFSFYPSKNLGALGDGGIVCARDPAVAAAARRLRNLGQEAHGEHVVAGYNERLDTLQAAFLRVKLGHLEGWNAERRRAAERYRERLPAGVAAPPKREGAEDVFHLLAVKLDDRDALARSLASAGIHTGVHYRLPLHRQPPMAGLPPSPVELGQAEDWAARELSLPMFPGLREDEVDRVCAALAGALGRS